MFPVLAARGISHPFFLHRKSGPNNSIFWIATGARPGHIFRQAWDTRGLQGATFPAKTVGPVEAPQEVVVEEKQPIGQPNANGAWENAPRIDLVCRAYSGTLKIFWDIFFPTYLVSGFNPMAGVWELPGISV